MLQIMTLLVQFSKIYSCFGYKNMLNSLLTASVETLFLNWRWICVGACCMVSDARVVTNLKCRCFRAENLVHLIPDFPNCPWDIGKLFSKMPWY